LDRDGVINRKAPNGFYITSWKEFEFLAGVSEAISLLNRSGFKVIVISNQRGIARGMLTQQKLQSIHRKMLASLVGSGARIDAIHYCPHNEGECRCRKPEIGLFLKAQRDFPEIVFEESFVIGDSWRDIEASKTLGCKGLLIQQRQVSAKTEVESLPIDGQASSLLEAVKRYVIPGPSGESSK